MHVQIYVFIPAYVHAVFGSEVIFLIDDHLQSLVRNYEYVAKMLIKLPITAVDRMLPCSTHGAPAMTC